jgi:hypothetical protein
MPAGGPTVLGIEDILTVLPREMASVSGEYTSSDFSLFHHGAAAAAAAAAGPIHGQH